jgi:hypothetical protein
MLYRYRDFEYAVGVANGTVAATESGARVVTKASGALRLLLAQT